MSGPPMYSLIPSSRASIQPNPAHFGPAWRSRRHLPQRRLAGAMADPAGTSQPGLSVPEAAVMLGVSPNTVRRWVATGRLRSERIPRPQGDMIRVFLDQVPDEVPKQVPPGEVPP